MVTVLTSEPRRHTVDRNVCPWQYRWPWQHYWTITPSKLR